MQEVAEKLENEKKEADMRKEITKNNEDCENFLRSMIRNHEQWVYSSTILTYWAVMTDLRSSSSSYYLEFKKAELRSWNASKYTREYEYLEQFDRQHAQRDLDELYNDSRNLWRWRGFWEKRELRKMGAKNHCNQYLHLAFQ